MVWAWLNMKVDATTEKGQETTSSKHETAVNSYNMIFHGIIEQRKTFANVFTSMQQRKLLLYPTNVIDQQKHLSRIPRIKVIISWKIMNSKLPPLLRSQNLKSVHLLTFSAKDGWNDQPVYASPILEHQQVEELLLQKKQEFLDVIKIQFNVKYLSTVAWLTTAGNNFGTITARRQFLVCRWILIKALEP